jgi:pantoate kinase
MGNAIAQQLNRFESVVDDASCDSRIGEGLMKAAALSGFVVRIHPQCPVVGTLDKVYPKPESEFGKHLSRLSAKAVFNSRLIERVAPVR